MTKRELIDGIARLNPSAGAEFLAQFDVKDLQDYLEHLQWVCPPALDHLAQAAQTPAPEAAQSDPATETPAEKEHGKQLSFAAA